MITRKEYKSQKSPPRDFRKDYKSQTSPPKDYLKRIQILVRYFIMIQINGPTHSSTQPPNVDNYWENAMQRIFNGIVVAIQDQSM